MTKPIYIVGHKNPDTDSVCAAIAYANLKQELGYHVVACRAGDINRETGFVLEYFGIENPYLLSDLHCRVKDLLNGTNVVINPEIPILEAWLTMRSHEIKTLSVVDQNNHLLGLVTAGDLAEKFLADLGERNLTDMQVSVKNVLTTLNGTLTYGSAEIELRGKIVIWSGDEDGSGNPGCFALVGNDRIEQGAALRGGAACLILTGGAELSDDLQDQVKATGVVVITVPVDIFTAARLILTSIPVGSIMITENLLHFHEDDLVDEAKKSMLETRFRSYPVVDEQNRVLGTISRYHLLGYSRKKVILVDHNELSQSVKGAEEAQIIEVLDHHKVGGVQTGEPILFRNEPVGATCTLVAKAYFENGISLSREMAGLLCAGILSDTVLFKSPTSTPSDREVAERLAKIARIELQEFGIDMLKKGSALSGLTPWEVLSRDFKEFRAGKARIGIGQVNAMGFDEVAPMKQDLLKEMEVLRQKTGLDYCLLMVTDLLTEATGLLIKGDKPNLIGEAFKGEVIDNEICLPDVLSRKKQVVPPLVKYFS